MKAWRRVGAIIVIALVLGAAYLTLGTRTAPARSPQVSADADAAEIQQRDMPRFTPDGSLLRPDGWEAWVMVGTSMGLTYTEAGGPAAPMPGAAPGMFHNVFMQPWAYQHFQETGEFAEETMFVLAMSQPSRKADPAQGGFYEGDRFLSEIHLKKEGLHESGWGFYGFGREAESATMIPGAANCYSCHAEHAAFDQVFVQFYPPLRRVKEGK